MLKPLCELCTLVALMTRIHDGRLNDALAITPVYLKVLTPRFPPRPALFSLRGFLWGRKIQRTTNSLYLCLLLDMTIQSIIHPIVLVLRAVASASSDKFYEFSVVYSDWVLDLVFGYSIFYGQLIRGIPPPVHFVPLNGFLRTRPLSAIVSVPRQSYTLCMSHYVQYDFV